MNPIEFLASLQPGDQVWFKPEFALIKRYPGDYIVGVVAGEMQQKELTKTDQNSFGSRNDFYEIRVLISFDDFNLHNLWTWVDVDKKFNKELKLYSTIFGVIDDYGLIGKFADAIG